MRFPKRGLFAATVLLLFVLERASAEQEGKDRGFFRFGCTPLVTAPVDPIPGNGEGFFKHPHYVFGSDAMAPFITEDSVTNLLEKSTCTTCNIDADRSLYWFPALYVKNSEGSYNLCRAPRTQIYYLDRGVLAHGQKKIAAFPKGLRMIAGDPLAREASANTRKSQLVFKQLDYLGCDITSDGFPDSVECPVWQTRLNYPNCWNGKDLYQEDMSHISYRDDDDRCPESHPVLMPELFVEVDIEAGDCVADAGPGVTSKDLILSTLDTTGYSWHSDFISGWSESLLERALNLGRPSCYVAPGSIPGSTNGPYCTEAEKAEPKCFAFSPEDCEPLMNMKDGEGPTHPNPLVPSGIGFGFCTPVAAFPNARIEKWTVLPSSFNPGTIDMQGVDTPYAGVPTGMVAVEDSITRYTPVYIRSATTYRYCSNNYDSVFGGPSGVLCDKEFVRNMGESSWEKFYLVPVGGEMHVTHLSKVFLVSASHYNAGMSSCQISWGNRAMFCKWPLYQANHALTVDIQNPSEDGILRNTDLVSFIHRRGGRVGVDEYGVVGAREAVPLDGLRTTSDQWQPRSPSYATTLFQIDTEGGLGTSPLSDGCPGIIIRGRDAASDGKQMVLKSGSKYCTATDDSRNTVVCDREFIGSGKSPWEVFNVVTIQGVTYIKSEFFNSWCHLTDRLVCDLPPHDVCQAQVFKVAPNGEITIDDGSELCEYDMELMTGTCRTPVVLQPYVPKL